jgi:hypothetical protein
VITMRHATLILGLLALLALVACGGGEKSPEEVAAAHAAAGDCDPANCASSASGGCAKATAGAQTAESGCSKSCTHGHGAEAKVAQADGTAPEGKVYGAGVTSASTVAVSAVLAHPETYLGQTVRVQGPVVGVCKHRGCWIEIASDKEMQKIQLKVDDGVIVFPPEIMGETAIVEGKLEGIPLTYEQACAYLEQEASCQGEKFDKSAVPADGITFYRIKGTGAVVLPATES